ncbi:hypothetical protein D3C86_1408360 [compost metagenome]
MVKYTKVVLPWTGWNRNKSVVSPLLQLQLLVSGNSLPYRVNLFLIQNNINSISLILRVTLTLLLR